MIVIQVVQQRFDDETEKTYWMGYLQGHMGALFCPMHGDPDTWLVGFNRGRIHYLEELQLRNAA